MIRELTIRNFKRYEDATVRFPGHLVLAGPNNTGKTTILQALMAWSFAVRQWRLAGRQTRFGGRYQKVEIGRRDFTPVPISGFEGLWHGQRHVDPIVIEVQDHAGRRLGMRFEWDTPQQLYVRPTEETVSELAAEMPCNFVFIPAATAVAREETLYKPEFVDLMIGQGRPGEVLRNLLLAVLHEGEAWPRMAALVAELFGGYRLLPPNAEGAYIIANYQQREGGPEFDISSAGSGFQQVLTLLSFLFTRQGVAYLVDEPDAHLHVILQDVIWSRLRSVAGQRNAQLIAATHAEVIIDSIAPEELCIVFNQPRLLADRVERTRLTRSLATLSQTDVMLALEEPGILYLEGHTDLDNLREWARVLGHPLAKWLGTSPFWRPIVFEHRDGGKGVKAQDHFDALRLVHAEIRGLIMLDSEGKRRIPETPITGQGLQRLAWRRYETEAYLVHPAAIERYIESKVGAEAAVEAVAAARAVFDQEFGSELSAQFRANPLQPPNLIENFLQSRKARTGILPALLTAAGVGRLEYVQYYEIAAQMLPEEIHPEVTEKLNLIQQALGL